MKKQIRLLFFLLFISVPTFVSAQDKKSATELLKALHSEGILRVKFVEKVKVPFLKHALRSEGQLVVHPKGHFLREITSPTTSMTVLTGDAITIIDKSGTTTLDKSTAPEVLSAMTLLQALVLADAKALKKRYIISVKNVEKDGNWSVVLKSRESKSIFKQCTVRGKGSQVSVLTLIESEGVKRVIEFGKMNRNATLTAKETKLLKLP